MRLVTDAKVKLVYPGAPYPYVADFSRDVEKVILRVFPNPDFLLSIVNNYRLLTISLWKKPRCLVV